MTQNFERPPLAGLFFNVKGFWIVFFTFCYSVANFAFAGVWFVADKVTRANKLYDGFDWFVNAIISPFFALSMAFVASLAVTVFVMQFRYDEYYDKYDFKWWQVALVGIGGAVLSFIYLTVFFSFFR